MKVVLFCGGLGTRLREHSDTIPKPLVNIGTRPVLWHLMRYYAYHGHTDFVLALGYRGDMIREYFLNYQEAMSNDFTLSDGGRSVQLHTRDMENWRITFVDTGLHANVGQRLLAVQKYLAGEEMFLANYSDGLSDLPLNKYIDIFKQGNAVASFATVRSSQSFHAIHAEESGIVTGIGTMSEQPLWINGGFFVLRKEFLNYVKEGDLMEESFPALIKEKRLTTYRWEGFWQCMDTFKDKITLDRMEARGACPWKVWLK